MTRQVRVSIDWLRYSMPVNDDKPFRTSVSNAMPPGEAITPTGERLPNARGYNQCMALSIGRMHWHDQRPEQMISVEFRGTDCHDLHLSGFDFAGLWKHIEASGGHISTVHFAIDLIGYSADHLELETALQSGKAISSAKSVYTFQGGQIGDGRTEGTTYVGRPSSDWQLRVYNKAAERGVDEDWTRIELVVKGKRAKALLAPLTAVGWAVVARSAIDNFVKWQNGSWWQHAIHGEVIKMPKVERRQNKTREWLINQVAKTLERELRAEKDEDDTTLARIFAFVVDYQ